jgi:putative ABC transport system permease protein
VYALINVIGLAVGLAVIVMIVLFVNHELTFDRFFENSDRICRLVTESETSGRRVKMPKATYETDKKVPGQLPEVESSTVLYRRHYKYFHFNENKYGKYQHSYVDEDFFDVFSFSIVKGDPSQLRKPNTIVLTQQTAEDIFSNQNPVDKTIRIGEKDYQVIAVMENVPAKSHLHFQALLSIHTFSDKQLNSHGHDFYTYFLLNQPYSPDLERKICSYTESIDEQRYENSATEFTHKLQPLKRIHLHSDFSSDIARVTNIRYIFIFSGIALIILLIASFNFINISVARASTRFKEVGIRKVNGASQGALRKQFIGESVMIALFSFVISAFLVELFAADFLKLIGSNLYVSFQNSMWWIPGGIILALLIGLAAGIYPAFYLSRLTSIKVLKGAIPKGKNKPGLQNALVSLQFFMAIALIASLIGIITQNNYLKKKDLGFDKKNVVMLRSLTNSIQERYEPIKQELLRNPNIMDVTASLAIPGTKGPGTNVYTVDGTSEESVQIRANIIKKNFPDFYDIQILEGEAFSEKLKAETNAVLINQKLAESLNMAAPVGKVVRMWGERKYITGVFKSYHNRSLHHEMDPVVLHQNIETEENKNRYINYVSVKLSGNQVKSSVAYIENILKQYDPNYIFQYNFVDNYLQKRYYQSERKYAKLIMAASIMAIILSVMGLFALTAFYINQRMKEVGTRKVFGARPAQIIWLFNRKYLFWVVISAIFAIPAAHFFISRWYADFSYHTQISWWFYGLALGVSISIAFLTIFSKTYIAANTNPAVILRDE